MEKQLSNELLSLTNDHVFRSIFGQKRINALADFLSAVLDLPTDELNELIVDDPNIHTELDGGKSSVLDVRVHTKSGSIINVEIQVSPEAGFKDRIAFLNSRIFSGQLRKGERYITLNRTVSVIITNYRLLKKNDDYFNRFRWYNNDNGTLLTDKQEINILELEKLPQEDDGTKLWHWLKLMKLRRLDEMEKVAKDNEVMRDVIVTLREMSADEAEERIAFARETEWRDREAAREYGLEEGREEGLEIGREEGLEIGREEGREEGRLEVAGNLKEAGAEKALILKVTGISEEEYNTL